MTRGGRPPKLTPAQVETMRRHRAAGIGSEAIARLFGVAPSTARRYHRNECRKHREAA